jgi:hypothetical protein
VSRIKFIFLLDLIINFRLIKCVVTFNLAIDNIFFGKFFLLTLFCFYLFFLSFLSFFFVLIFSPIFSPPIIQSNPIPLSSSFSSFSPLFTRAQVHHTFQSFTPIPISFLSSIKSFTPA